MNVEILTPIINTSLSNPTYRGPEGKPGKDGHTPIKGVDYFDGKNGADGKDGKDGHTPVKGVDYFDGKDGAPGEDGKDYVLTDADKEEIAGMVDLSGADVEIDEKTIKKTTDGKLQAALNFATSGDYTSAWGGNGSKANSNGAFAFGHLAEANSYASAAFNVGRANANKAFATGYFTNATGENSAVFGENTTAQGTDQVVMGKYNLTDRTSALIIGNGDSTTKSNAMTVGFDGNVWAAGEITVGADKKKLITADDVPTLDLTGYATEEYVDDAINQALVGDGADLSDYYTKDEVAALGYQTAAQVEAAISTALGNIGVAEEGAY